VTVSGEFFATLGAPALLGRTIAPDDDRPGAAAVMVISQGFWQRRFGGRADIIGERIALDGEPATIVGVMPAAVQFPRAADIANGQDLLLVPEAWTGLRLSTGDRERRGWHAFLTIGRLKPGLSVDEANAQIVTIGERLQRDHPDTDTGWNGRVEWLRVQQTSGLRGPLNLLGGAAALVLLIACANVANLLLASGASRQREIALRLALGARPRDIVRQLLIESVALAFAGGTLGLLLAAWGLLALRGLLPEPLAPLRALSIDWSAFAFTAALSTLAGMLSGAAPSLIVLRGELRHPLNDAGRGSTTGHGGRRTRRGLVIVETALAVTLLVIASLLLRSYWTLLQVDPGFRREQGLSFRVSLPGSRYTPEQRVAFFDRLLARSRCRVSAAARRSANCR
jgi:predicted permease